MLKDYIRRKRQLKAVETTAWREELKVQRKMREMAKEEKFNKRLEQARQRGISKARTPIGSGIRKPNLSGAKKSLKEWGSKYEQSFANKPQLTNRRYF